jgi:hypothetical protein
MITNAIVLRSGAYSPVFLGLSEQTYKNRQNRKGKGKTRRERRREAKIKKFLLCKKI